MNISRECSHEIHYACDDGTCTCDHHFTYKPDALKISVLRQIFSLIPILRRFV